MAAPGAVASPPAIAWAEAVWDAFGVGCSAVASGSTGGKGSITGGGVDPPLAAVAVVAFRTTLVETWVSSATAGLLPMTGLSMTTSLRIDAVFFLTGIDSAGGDVLRVNLFLAAACCLSTGVSVDALFSGARFFLLIRFFGRGLFFVAALLRGAAFRFGVVVVVFFFFRAAFFFGRGVFCVAALF